MGKKIFVGNLAFSTTSTDLESLFSETGTCESATVVTDRETGRSRGNSLLAKTGERERPSIDGEDVLGWALALAWWLRRGRASGITLTFRLSTAALIVLALADPLVGRPAPARRATSPDAER